MVLCCVGRPLPCSLHMLKLVIRTQKDLVTGKPSHIIKLGEKKELWKKITDERNLS